MRSAGRASHSAPFCFGILLPAWLFVASYSMRKYKNHLAGRQGINSVFHDSKPVSTHPEKDWKSEPLICCFSPGLSVLPVRTTHSSCLDTWAHGIGWQWALETKTAQCGQSFFCYFPFAAFSMLEGPCAMSLKMLRGASQGNTEHHTLLGACNCALPRHEVQNMKVRVWANSLISESMKGEKLIPSEGSISGQPSLHRDYPPQPWALWVTTALRRCPAAGDE